MTSEELKIVLDAHGKWLRGESGGQRANLTGADLTGADLTGANLTGANLTGADLTVADLTGADLTTAYLTGANLTGAELTRADLTRASLYGADLTGANLTGANLSRANLSRANLSRADLTGADLTGADLPHFSVCPDEGAFIGWKKVQGDVILKLQIPEDARRTSSMVGRKCRADKVVVLSAETLDGKPVEVTEFTSAYDPEFVYRVGETHHEPNFCNDIRQECRPGLHFYITRREAVAH